MLPKADVEMFVKGWVTRNVRSVPGLANLNFEVDRLAADLTGEARANGISGGDLNRAMGDIDEYLTGQYERVSAVPVA
ncbi:MAG TPA: hypothetical protein VNN98_00625 [Rhizomicrobium sp.]|nr:hypothetical protein [Rhizomicrobium sp.]